MKNKAKDQWTIAQGREEGMRLMLRLNESVGPLAGNQQYSFRVSIVVPFKSPNADGTPKVDEFKHLDGIEDTIIDRFNAKQTGVLCIIVTTQGMQQFVIYSKTDNVGQIIKDIALHFPEYNFKHSVEQDKNWDQYKHWVEELGE